MPPKKSKEKNVYDIYNLRRRPIGWSADVIAEKENTGVSSADDSPRTMFLGGSPGSQRGVDPEQSAVQEFEEASSQHVFTDTRYRENLVDNSEMCLEVDNFDITDDPFNHSQENEFPDYVKNIGQEFNKEENPVDNNTMHYDNFVDYEFNHRKENQFSDHTKNVSKEFREDSYQNTFRNAGYRANPVDNSEMCVGNNFASTNFFNQRQTNAFSGNKMLMGKKNRKHCLPTEGKCEEFTQTQRRNKKHARKKSERHGKNCGSASDLECAQHQKNFKKIYPDEIKSQKKFPSQSQTDSCNLNLKSSLRIFWVIFAIILIICMVRFFRMPYHDSYETSQLNATTLVNNLKLEFPDQPEWTFRIIHSALKNVLNSEPKAPAVILLLATNGSQSVCVEFASKLVDLLSVPETTLKTFSKDYRKANVNHAKKVIDDAISNTLKVHELGSILLNDLDQIPGQVAIMLHSYCDHENAPFKKAVYVMTVNYDKVISDYANMKTWDKVAHDHLLSVWTDLGVDQVEPLLARLTVSVALITVKSAKK